MKLTDEKIQKALKNLKTLNSLVDSGLYAGDSDDAKQGMQVSMIGRDNLPQFIMIVEDLIHYKSKVEEMQKTLEWYAEEKTYEDNNPNGFEPILDDKGIRARQALKGESQ